MNLKHLTDETLHIETHRVNREQNQLLVQLLHHLRENERRRLFSAYKYPSLFAYVVGELKFSEDEAARRISAMRLLRDVPEIEEKISTGALSMTNLVMAQTLFSKERKAGRNLTHQDKKQVLARIENQSVRSARQIVAEINPEMKGSEIGFESIHDHLLREKLLKIKGLYAHKGNLSLNELLHQLCDMQIEVEMKRRSASPAAARVDSIAEIRRKIWARDGHKCTNCSSTHAVQEDHRIPKAMGGKYTLDNIRLLCRSCNQRAAMEFYGIDKIEIHVDPKVLTEHYNASGALQGEPLQ